MSGRADQDEEIKSPRSRSPVMGVTGLLREQSKGTPQSPTTEGERRASGGILRLDPTKPRRRSSATSMEFRSVPEDPSSPCPSDRLSVTWADGEKSISSETSMTLKGRAENLSGNPSLTTLRPVSTPRSPPPEFSPTKDLLGEPEMAEDDLEASVSMILQRSASFKTGKHRRSRRKSRRVSTLTSSSAESDSEASASKVKIYREVIGGIKQQPWPITRKLHLARTAREFLARHEGDLEERLAQSSSKKDVLYSHFIRIRRVFQAGITWLYNWFMSIELWEGRIKRIESHFGSAVASYFTFLRWVMGLNAVIAILLAAFVIIPETLAGDWERAGERKQLLKEERPTAFDLKVMWDFEGFLRYSPIFYGYYGKQEKNKEGYRLPLAYILTSMCVYGYSFIAILRKMAANSRLSKLGDNDESIFTFKLFTGWDYTIGNTEAAQNKVASINMGFKESLLEAKEAEKELVSWKVKAKRCLAHFIFLSLLLSSAYAVVLLVERSKETGPTSSWWRQNELTVILTLISNSFPNLFDLIGKLENNHPRKQLQWQLGRIMILNLLNLYTLIFALFGKVNDMSAQLTVIRSKVEHPEFLNRFTIPTPTAPLGLPNIDASASVSTLLGGMTTAAAFVYNFTESRENKTFFETSLENKTAGAPEHDRPRCRQIRVPCLPEDTKSYLTVEPGALLDSEPPLWKADSIAIVHNNNSSTLQQNITENSFVHSLDTTTPFFTDFNNASTVKFSLDNNFENITAEDGDNFKNLTSSVPLNVLTLNNLEESDGENFVKPNLQDHTTSKDDQAISLSTFTSPSTNSYITSNSKVLDEELTFSSSTSKTATSTTTKSHIVELSRRAMPEVVRPFAILYDLYDFNSTDSWHRNKREANWFNAVAKRPESTPGNTNYVLTSPKKDNLRVVKREVSINDINSDESPKESMEKIGYSNVNKRNSVGALVKPVPLHHWENTSIDNNKLSLNEIPENFTTENYDISFDPYTDNNKLPLSKIENNTGFLMISNDTINDTLRVTLESNLNDSIPTGTRFNAENDNFSVILSADYLVNESKLMDTFVTLSSNDFIEVNDSLFGESNSSIQPEYNTVLHNDQNFTLLTDSFSGAPSTFSYEESMSPSADVTDTANGTKELDYFVTEATTYFPDNTDDYLHYSDTSLGGNEDCYIEIEECNDTEVSNIVFDDNIDQENETLSKSENNTLTERSLVILPTSTTSITTPASSTTTLTNQNPEYLAIHLPASNRTLLRKLCWETMFGQEIVKLTVMDLSLTIFMIVIGEYVRAVVIRVFNNCCSWDLEKQFPGYPSFSVAENILHLVNNQGLVWMGMFFTPGITALNCVKLVVILYVRSWAVMTSNVPPETVFKASDNNNFYLALLLVMLFLCTLPVGYAVVWLRPSWHCGPFSDYPKIYQLATTNFINSLPDWCEPIIDYISSPGVIIPGGLLLILIIYYLMALTASLREAIQDLKDQLRRERNEEKRKAQEARAGKRVETPTTKWGRVMQLTPLPSNRFERKETEKSKSNHADDKIPLLKDDNLESKGVDSPIPDDVTDLGQSEVFDDSLSETRRSTTREAKPKMDKVRDASTQNFSPVYAKKSRRDSNLGEEREKKSRRESEERKKRRENGKSEERKRRKGSQESLNRSPRPRSKHRHNHQAAAAALEEGEGSPLQKTFEQRDSSKNRDPINRDSPGMRQMYYRDSPKRESYHRDSPKLKDSHHRDSPRDSHYRDSPRDSHYRDSPRDRHYRDSPKSRDSQWRRSSKEQYKDSPKKHRNSHRFSDSDYAERRDSGPKITQQGEIDKISKEYPELGDVFDSRFSLKDKRKKGKQPPSSKERGSEEESPKRFSFSLKHKRDPPIVTLSEVHSEPSKLKKRDSKKLKKEMEIKEETPEMQTIPIIKISKEDSVERSIQQAKLERQEKTEETRSVTPQAGAQASLVDIHTESAIKRTEQAKEFEHENLPMQQTCPSEPLDVGGEQQHPLKRQMTETDSEYTSTTTTALTSPVTSPSTIRVASTETKLLETDMDDIEYHPEKIEGTMPSDESVIIKLQEKTPIESHELADIEFTIPVMMSSYPDDDRPVAPEDLTIDPETLAEYEKMQRSFEDETTELENYEEDSVGVHEEGRDHQPRYRSRKPPKLSLPTGMLAKPEDDNDLGHQKPHFDDEKERK